MSDAVSATGILVKRSPGDVVTILTSSVAAASVITTNRPHGMVTGDQTTIAGHAGSTPDINGAHTVTVLSPTTYSIPVNVTVAGAGGTSTPTQAFTTIGEIMSVTPPGLSRNKIETSTHNDGTESYILGILRQKDPQFRINFVGANATHQRMMDDINNNVKATWRVEFPSGTMFTGPARVQKFDFVDVPVDAAQQADIGVSWAGPVTFAAA